MIQPDGSKSSRREGATMATRIARSPMLVPVLMMLATGGAACGSDTPGPGGSATGPAARATVTGEPARAIAANPNDVGTSAAGAAAPAVDPRTERTDVSTDLWFEDISETAGIDFRHSAGYSDDRWMPETIGGGVAVADFDRDGDPDVLMVSSGTLVEDTMRPEGAENRLYINQGDGTFQDATDAWGLSSDGLGYGMGVAVGDVDGDGWSDVVLTMFGARDRLLRNTGNSFVDETEQRGMPDDDGWSASAAFFDIEQDGDLDLWITRYVEYDLETAVPCYDSGVHIYCTPEISAPVTDRLLRNDGDGTFTDITEAAGLASDAPGRGFALTTGDVDGDGDTDVYVANDLTRNQLWLNDGSGRFEEVGQLAGVAYSDTGIAEAGMGADMSDVDGDGRMDLMVPNFQGQTTSVYLQESPMLFREASDALGVGMTARSRLGFGIDAFDADNDGDEDILVANGHLYDNIEQIGRGLTFPQPNSLYENRGGAFLDVTSAAGPALEATAVSRGVATGDLDGDGMLDYVVANNGGLAQVARNATTPAGNWIGLWLEGAEANRNAIGARVTATADGDTIRREVAGAQSFLSVSDFRIHLGLGSASGADLLRIDWPGGLAQEIRDLPAGRWYYVRQGRAPTPFTPGAEPIAP